MIGGLYFCVFQQDGKKISPDDEHVKLDYNNGRCTLSIDRVSIDDEAEYICEARNTHGTASTWAELLVESKSVIGRKMLIRSPVNGFDWFLQSTIFCRNVLHIFVSIFYRILGILFLIECQCQLLIALYAISKQVKVVFCKNTTNVKTCYANYFV